MSKFAYERMMIKKRDMAIEALQEMLNQSGLSASALAKKAGISHTTITRPLDQYKRGERNYEISYETLSRTVNAIGFESYEHFVAMWMGDEKSRSADFTYISRYKDVAASAGPGAENDEQTEIEMVPFRTDWLRSITNTAPQKLIVINVRGESMEPTLKDGDQVLVDTTKTVPNDDGMYVLHYDGHLLVKRITIDPIRKEIIISSDNRNHAPLKVYSAEEVRVNGRVMWLGRKT